MRLQLRPSMVATGSSEPRKSLRANQDLNFLRSIARFFASTSLHGVNRIFDAEGFRSPCQLVWLAIVCTATLGLCLHIGQQVQHYLSYPLSSSSRLALNAFTFPDLTLCDPETPIRTRWVNLSKLGAANDKIQNLTGFWRDPAYRPMFRYEHYINFSDKGTRPVDSIVHCQYNERRCSWRNFTTFFDRSYGNCFTFKPEVRRPRRADMKFGLTLLLYHPSADVALERQQLVGKMGYKMRGKEMAFQGESVLVTIHPEDTIPYPQENAHMAPLGMVTLMALQQEATSIQATPANPCQRRRRIRMFDSLLSRRVSYANTMYDCANWRDKLHIRRQCGCLPEGLVDTADFPDPDRIPFCHNVTRGHIDNVTELLEMVQPQNNLTEGISDYLRRRQPQIYRQFLSFLCYHKPDIVYNATCHELCESTSYSAKISSAHWPHRILEEGGDDHLKQVLQISAIVQDYLDAETSPDNLLRLSMAQNNLSLAECHARLTQWQLDSPGKRTGPDTLAAIASCHRVHKFVSGHFLLVRVYPQTLTVKQLKIETNFQLPQLLSSIGGCLGLWIGISLVTMFEFLEVLFIVLKYGVARCIGKVPSMQRWSQQFPN